MQNETIRRLSNGSIDCAFYQRQARKLRAEAKSELFKGWRGVAWPLMAVAVISAPLALASMVHELKGGPSRTAGAGQPAAAIGMTLDRNVQARNRSHQWWQSYGQRHLRSRDVAMANQ